MVPDELDLSLAVDREVQRQADSIDGAWRAPIEQARYEARRAERRYKAVDPENRVVTRALERDWEQRLLALEEAERQHAEARRAVRVELPAVDRALIRELARDLPAVWAAPTTCTADRKAMLRLVVEAVALHPIDVPTRTTRIRVQWRSGAVSEIELARPGRGQYRTHAPEAVQRIWQLATAGLDDDAIAQRLHAEGRRTGGGCVWTAELVVTARRKHRIRRVTDQPRNPALPHRHPDDGRYSIPGASAHFGVSESSVRSWIDHEFVAASRADFGTHCDVYWLDIDDAVAARLRSKIRRRPTTRKE